ncbi:MAG: diguanylate cyclase [Anaerolineales bacterium]|nr:diguanylate cyclase [Anaerolineales bacterium]
MEIKLYVKMLQRGWWIIALTALFAFNGALIAAYFATPMYQTTATFSVSPSAALSGADQVTLNSMEALDKRSITQTYAEFLNSQHIYEETVRGMGLDPINLEEYSRSTVVLPDANILSLTVSGEDPELVAALTNNIGRKAILAITELYKVYDIQPLDPAIVSLEPVSPKPVRDGAIALVLGLVLGAALAIVREEIRIPLDAYRQRLNMDPVSNVYNRKYIERTFNEIASVDPEKITSIGLIRFNAIAEMIDSAPLGVLQQLLRQITTILKDQIRGNDILGRWDDSTFIFILPATVQGDAFRTLERIRSRLVNPMQINILDESISLRPYVSVAEIQPGDTGLEAAERAENLLEEIG